VEVSTARGSVFHAKAVVVTVPVAALQRNTIAFSPPLPAEKQVRSRLRTAPSFALAFAGVCNSRVLRVAGRNRVHGVRTCTKTVREVQREILAGGLAWHCLL
jgi:hypothetical protein